MQTAGNNQEFKYDDLTWYLIAEYWLGRAISYEEIASELTAGLLFNAMRDLGIPPECLKRIEETITEATRGARDSFNHSLPDLPVCILLFCTNKTTESVHHAENQMNGGWGYYVIERGRDFPNAPDQECIRVVELYLYKEGE